MYTSFDEILGVSMLRAAVVGAGGYAGIEAARILLAHPGFELTCVVSDANEGLPLSEVYPALAGSTDLVYSRLNYAEVADQCDVVFLAVPHTAAMPCAPFFLERGIAVIDLSADFRIHDPLIYEKWYDVAHASRELLQKAIYGQPETHREDLRYLHEAWMADHVANAPLVACAGCYPTATILAAVPALEAGLVMDGPLVVNAMSGVSGAGKKLAPRTHFCSAHDSVQAYSAGKHRHAPEIAQELSIAAGYDQNVIFTPHLVPMKRGLLSTVTLPLRANVAFDDVIATYGERYDPEPFVHFLRESMPQTASVIGGNHAHVGIAYDEYNHAAIASCAIDNLDKGAASQAVQCANIVCGYEEDLGLLFPHPVV